MLLTQVNSGTYVHTGIHVHIRTYRYTCTHTYIHTGIHVHIEHTGIHVHLRTYIYTGIHVHIRTYRYTCTYTYIHTYIQVYTGADPGGAWGAVAPPPLSKWSMTSCAYNCQPLLCFSLANTHTSRMPCWYLLA